jgi:hypothetical protein
MELGEHARKTGAWRGSWVRAALGSALALALIFGSVARPAWSEPQQEKDRFVKIGGPVSENIDIDKIKALLKSAKGVSLVDKLELRQHLITFTEEFYKFHKGTSEKTLSQLRARFIELHHQIVALLSPENPQLSARFDKAAGALWSAYSDREAFISTVGRDVVNEAEGAGAASAGERYEVAPQPGTDGLLAPALKKVPEKVHDEGGVNR